MTTWNNSNDQQTGWRSPSGYISQLIAGTPIGLLLSLTYAQNRDSWEWGADQEHSGMWSGSTINTDWSATSSGPTVWS